MRERRYTITCDQCGEHTVIREGSTEAMAAARRAGWTLRPNRYDRDLCIHCLADGIIDTK